MRLCLRVLGAAGLIAIGYAAAMARQNVAAGAQQAVRAREVAFAKTMADRDFNAFSGFVSSEAVFLGRTTLRGRQQVSDGWKRFFEGPEAPFSWRPETVEVLDSGTLGLTSGPVFDPQGKPSGTFSSIWRLESDSRWRVVFDKGCP